MSRIIATRFGLPDCLSAVCETGAYLRWLTRKARAHVRRDRKRYGHETCSVSEYKRLIHEAVNDGGNLDYYTGLPLDWSLISKFDNTEAKAGRSEYLLKFGNLPTVDHTRDSEGRIRFAICSWRVNDAKSHLSEGDFLRLCEQVVFHRGGSQVGR
jgi:hypothetical protein